MRQRLPGIAVELADGFTSVPAIDQLVHELGRNGDNMCAGESSVLNAIDLPDASRDDLASVAPLSEPVDRLADELGRVVALISQTAGEDAGVDGPRPSG